MPIDKSDLYTITLFAVTSYIFVDFISLVTNQPIFTILNSSRLIVFIGLLLILCCAAFIIFNIYSKIINHVKNIFLKKDTVNSQEKLAAILPQTLVLAAIYGFLIAVQAIWYIVNSG